MTVDELRTLLASFPPNDQVVVVSGKWGYKEARVVKAGRFYRDSESFEPDMPGGDIRRLNAILIQS